MPPARTRRRAAPARAEAAPPVGFGQKLLLNQWILELLGAPDFRKLAEHLKDEGLEGLDDSNVHRFHTALCLHLPPERRPQLPDSELRRYDEAIVAVTQDLNERRQRGGFASIRWKYFQYLALLFTEIYLDRYFRDPQTIVAGLNEHAASLDSVLPTAERMPPLEVAPNDDAARLDLNKLAFWMATGSGKTLLMHAHILQYQRYLATHGMAHELNRIILLTPNEGLSQQHLREFRKAGIEAEIFSKDARGLFTGRAVEIIEVTKLSDQMGDKTVAVEAFEGNNLVLVDEGHRGASAGKGGKWMEYRNALCECGFSFEYSATFGQAVKGDRELTERYARSILFDYSYRWFYGDGFGKDYRILNLEHDGNDEWTATYLTACLLGFYQQQRVYREQEDALRPFNVERPLWVFVGGSVTANLSAREAPDVVRILTFLKSYVEDRPASVRRIEQILQDGLVTADGQNLFAGWFAHLSAAGLTAERLFTDSLATLFNAPAGGVLQAENLSQAPGEIALRVGQNPPFGVVNVGDDRKVLALCEENGIPTAESEFGGSLFHELERHRSNVHLLVGSKKFSEGWNSWRVSTMGLLNVGRGEGAQIIQLFGRGVRLKGFEMCLKRSARAALPPELTPPKELPLLETLNVFGVRADYMKQFRDFLNEEVPDVRYTEFVLPVIKHFGTQPLKTIALKKQINGVSTATGDPFKRFGPMPTVVRPGEASREVREHLQGARVTLNWYPRIGAIGDEGAQEQGLNTGCFNDSHIAFLDLDRIYFALERFKRERGWHNLNISRGALAELLVDPSWYRLQIPASELTFDDFSKVGRWQEIATQLLKKYVERFYQFSRRAWELPHLEYRALAGDDGNFPKAVREGVEVDGYLVRVEAAQTELIEKLRELEREIKEKRLSRWQFQGVKAVNFEQHLYAPLLSIDSEHVTVSPVPLNEGEWQFVDDLRAYHDRHPEAFVGRETYLLRNLSRGRGVGFFEAGNFHPDFIVWQVAGPKQRIAFVDPKGIIQVRPDDEKITFHKRVKELERRLGDPSVQLASYIVSTTASADAELRWGLTKAEYASANVLFQKEDRESYVGTILGHA